jgi:hypothetical protein
MGVTSLMADNTGNEVDASYTAYDEHTADEPDEWGDLASWRRRLAAQGPSVDERPPEAVRPPATGCSVVGRPGTAT